MQTAQHSSGGDRMLMRHNNGDAAEGSLEASLLTTLRFLAGMCLHCACVSGESVQPSSGQGFCSLAMPDNSTTLACGILADLAPCMPLP